MASKIVWTNLDRPRGLFTKRNATMVSLHDGAILQYYGANTKINVVQETRVGDNRYFRTETAATRGLDWAFKSSDFELPDDIASLEPSGGSIDSTISPFNSNTLNKNIAKTPKTTKSEVEVSEDRKNSLISAFKRFFRRNK